MNLTEFLLARIAEDEAEFDRAAEDEAARVRGDGMPETTAADVRAYWLSLGPTETRWPRLLAECEAKRQIVEAASDQSPGDCEDCGSRGGDHILSLLALPYVDHPDYRGSTSHDRA